MRGNKSPSAPFNQAPKKAAQMKPAVAQLKTGVKQPVAPPAYRPQPVPKVLQKKSSSLPGPPTSQAPRRPNAPPVYRPESKKIVQPKVIAQQRRSPAPPTVPRPEQKRVAQPKTVSAASTPARPKTPAAVIQRYSVLPRERVLHAMPAMVGKREPERPYAVVAGAEFIAQQSLPGRWGSDKGHDFLETPWGKEAYIVSRPLGAEIRLSDDGNMAIEDSDLSRRQPKEFYATSMIVRESNQALDRVGARVRLALGAHALTIVTARRQVIALYTVTPIFTQVPPQNCNAMAGEVIGLGSTFTGLKTVEAMKAAKKVAVKNAVSYDLASKAKGVRQEDFDKLETALVEEYVLKLDQSRDILEKEKINQYAQPGVGEAFMIGTLGNPINQNGGRARVLDIESGEVRTLGWRFHFAGVVAVSGNDRITLENYARGDDRRDDPDPRWYFQMYGGSAGQTFYDFCKQKREYANPVVVAVGK